MNRGRARQKIFHDAPYYQVFLDTLAEAKQRFHGIIHAYCLMGNHYHLLLETPDANLSRMMRHINGVYTQRHNRLKKTDGPLFRGRYKAVLVDKDAYLLQLSRYIHRNPIDSKRPLVRELATYPWSSYPAYINKTKTPDWLHREKTCQLLGHTQCHKAYVNYVMQGVDDDILRYYQRGNQTSIIGGKDFRAWVYENLLPELDAEEMGSIIRSDISMELIVEGVADWFKTKPAELTRVIKGPQKGNEARKIAMYLCQEMANVKLKDIEKYFNLGHIGSVSFVTHQIRKRKNEDIQLARTIDAVIASIIKKAT
jgi:REP element-mobilizing transposase RayT